MIESEIGPSLPNGVNSGLYMSLTTTSVNLPEKVMARIDKLKGRSGEGRSDTIRANVIASLSEKGSPRGG